MFETVENGRNTSGKMSFFAGYESATRGKSAPMYNIAVMTKQLSIIRLKWRLQKCCALIEPPWSFVFWLWFEISVTKNYFEQNCIEFPPSLIFIAFIFSAGVVRLLVNRKILLLSTMHYVFWMYLSLIHFRNFRQN